VAVIVFGVQYWGGAGDSLSCGVYRLESPANALLAAEVLVEGNPVLMAGSGQIRNIVGHVALHVLVLAFLVVFVLCCVAV
jgi:hypothetical protein